MWWSPHPCWWNFGKHWWPFVNVPHLNFSFFHSVSSSFFLILFSIKASQTTPGTSLKYFSSWTSAPRPDQSKQDHLWCALLSHWFRLVWGNVQMTSSWSKLHPYPTGSSWGKLPVGSLNRPTAFWPGLGWSSGMRNVRIRPSYPTTAEEIQIIKSSSVLPTLDRCIFCHCGI